MGRRPNQFCWVNVDKLPNGNWKCKHCNEDFSGGASRIRNHLSGEGKDITSCKTVPPHIREEALKRTTSRKTGKNSSASGEGNDGISAVANSIEQEIITDPVEANIGEASKKRGRNSGEGNVGISTVANIGDLSTNKGIEQEIITNAIVEFFVSNNITLDAVNHPLFQTFVTRAVQPDVSAGIPKSLSNLEDVVNEYMVRVKNSWKTTCCTVICYNLDELMGNPSNSEKDSVVYGFYCPKGFIFVQGPRCKSLVDLAGAFKNHVLNLPIDDVEHYIYHSGYQMCEFANEDADFDYRDSRHCGQQQFQQFWTSICTEPGWVWNIMQKSENLYEFMLNSSFAYRCDGWKKVAAQNDGDATQRSKFTRLRSIMHFEDGIKAYLSNCYWEENDGDVREIINNKEFWSDGKELLVVVTPLLHIIDLLDTLVPTSGYLQVAKVKAKDNLKPYYQRDPSKYQVIWEWLDDFETTTISDEVATCLSPFYDCGPEEWNPQFLSDSFTNDEEEDEKFKAELKEYYYNNPFANLSSDERERNNHPVTLWKKYGGGFPMLQKFAIKHMSQPTSCMCNQVKKHVLHCQGSDNFILRLNYQMMQEFTKLGDNIYEPLGREFFPGLIDTPARFPIHPVSPPTSAAYLGQIPAWMNEFILNYIDVAADGNCGYRAIAESVGLGQDKWHEVRQQLYNELRSQSQLYEPTFVYGNVETILKALSYRGSGIAPSETWLEVTDMGLLVATTFTAKFVVMGSTIRCTFLPLYLPKGWQFHNVREIVVCLAHSHFSLLFLTDNAPLPPISNMWLSHRRPSTQGFDRFLSDRCASYNKAAARYSEKGETPPIEIIAT